MTEYVVCPQCRGTGYGDGLGDVTEMLHEDPDFAEDYRAGLYNRGCEECGGLRVVPQCEYCVEPVQRRKAYFDPFVTCWDHMDPDLRAELEDAYEGDAIQAAEIRAGA
jgi:hypothetical protein